MTIRDTAEEFARTYGMDVIPLVNGKPFLTGVHGRDGDLSKITDADWERATHYGVIPVGHTVFDFDNQQAHDEWISTHGELPPVGTLVVKTPRGWHYYFKGEDFKKDITGQIEGVDVKIGSARGYLLGPGSRGHKAGYEDLSYEIIEQPMSGLIPVPDRWRAAVNVTRMTHERLENARPADDGVSMIPSGGRDATLVRIAGLWRRQGMQYEQLLMNLMYVNQTRCDPPMEQSDIVRIANSAMTWKDDAPDIVEIAENLELAEMMRLRHHMKDMSIIEQEKYLKLLEKAEVEADIIRARELGRDIVEKERRPQWDQAQIMFIHDVLELPPTDWFIDRVWPRADITMLYGDPGAKKSFLALDWALHLADGKDWHGHTVPRQMNVMYLVGEGMTGYGARARAFQSNHNQRLMTNNIRLVNVPVNLSQEHQAAQLIHWFDEKSNGWLPDLIVIDTLRRFTTGMEENSVKEVGRFIDGLQQHLMWMRSTPQYNEYGEYEKDSPGTAILLIHHANRSENGRGNFRGSSALSGDVDVVFRVQCDINNPLIQHIRPEKFKDAEQYEQYEVMYAPFADSISSISASEGSALADAASSEIREAQTEQRETRQREQEQANNARIQQIIDDHIVTWLTALARNIGGNPAKSSFQAYVRDHAGVGYPTACVIVDRAIEQNVITAQQNGRAQYLYVVAE